MSNEPFLSIIVPVYNAEKYLEECLDSILCQELADYELILVDDGSTDSSSKICDRYAAAHGQVRVLHQENKGLPAARQAGFALSHGKYIAFADSDDRVDRHMYPDLCALARQYQADIIHCDFTAVMPSKQKVCAVPYKPGYYDKKMLLEQVYPNMLYSGTYFTFGAAPNIWNKLFRRELLAKHLMQVPHDIRNGEDLLVTYPCLLDADSVYFTNVPYYYYISREESMCHSVTTAQLHKLFLLFDTIEKTFDTERYPFLKPQLAYYTVYQTLLYGIPVMQEMRAAGQKPAAGRALFLEIEAKPFIRDAMHAVRPSHLSGRRNKLFVYGFRLHLFALIRLAARPVQNGFQITR